MPEKNGIEATEYIREVEKRKHKRAVPIIGLTGLEDREFMDECIKAGMNAVVTKPINSQQVKEVIEKYCS